MKHAMLRRSTQLRENLIGFLSMLKQESLEPDVTELLVRVQDWEQSVVEEGELPSWEMLRGMWRGTLRILGEELSRDR
jgi:hypothetical protein